MLDRILPGPLQLTMSLLNSGAVLEYVAQYMQYWYMYKDKEDVPDMDIPVDLCLEVLMAADFLRMDRKSADLPSVRQHSLLTSLAE